MLADGDKVYAEKRENIRTVMMMMCAVGMTIVRTRGSGARLYRITSLNVQFWEQAKTRLANDGRACGFFKRAISK